MRILLCTSEAGNDAGGLAFHCVQLKEIYEELGHVVYVEILLNPDDYYVVEGGYDILLAEKIRYSYMLRKLMDKYSEGIDLCISCGGGRTAYYSMLYCKAKHVPLNIVLCGSEVNLSFRSSELLFYNSEALKYASSVIGLSRELNNNAKLLGFNPKCKYYIVPNYCAFPKCKKTVKEERTDEIVYATGASFLGEKKGIANLIVAFGILIHEKNRNDKLYLLGKIDSDLEKKYRDLVIKNSLEDNIFFKGYLTREEFHEIMKDVDVYIQASPFEGYGNSVAEAVAEGKDILISATGFIAETIENEFPDHVINTLETRGLAESMYKFAMTTFAKKESWKIRALLMDILSRENVVSAWKNILDNSVESEMRFENGICNAVMFHDIDNSYTGIDYNRDGYRKLMNGLFEKGIRLCSVCDYFKSTNRDKLIICTFDDGYDNVYKNAFPIMMEYGFTATVYICPDLIGKTNEWNHKDEKNRWHMTSEMIKELANAGWEVGSHGLSHMNLLRLSEKELDHSLAESKKRLEIYGKIESFCYPYGAFNSFIKNKVRNYYDNAFSVSIGGNNIDADRYQITRLTPEELRRRLELD